MAVALRSGSARRVLWAGSVLGCLPADCLGLLLVCLPAGGIGQRIVMPEK